MDKTTRRRLFQRLPCDLPLTMHDVRTGEFLGAGRFLDIGIGGGAIETELLLERGTTYHMRWHWRSQPIDVPAHMVWDGHRDPRTGSQRYGVKFNRTARVHAQLKDMVEHVLGQLWNSDGRTSKEYWKL
jgi:hypothetical protein